MNRAADASKDESGAGVAHVDAASGPTGGGATVRVAPSPGGGANSVTLKAKGGVARLATVDAAALATTRSRGPSRDATEATELTGAQTRRGWAPTSGRRRTSTR